MMVTRPNSEKYTPARKAGSAGPDVGPRPEPNFVQVRTSEMVPTPRFRTYFNGPTLKEGTVCVATPGGVADAAEAPRGDAERDVSPESQSHVARSKFLAVPQMAP